MPIHAGVDTHYRVAIGRAYVGSQALQVPMPTAVFHNRVKGEMEEAYRPELAEIDHYPPSMLLGDQRTANETLLCHWVTGNAEMGHATEGDAAA